MKQSIIKLASVLLLLSVLLCCVISCDKEKTPEHIDYAAEVKLDLTSDSAKAIDVTVKSYIDGDTTHFYVPTSISETGVLKARYLAVNTPESTGKIEEWGKKASKFTKEKLMSATSIILESDDSKWNLDSTGDRHLVWVWYKTAEMTEYRNLNLELLQEGLAIASNSAQNRYGTFCMDAITQATAEKLNVYSGERDDDFYYGEVISLDLKGLRCNVEDYVGLRVSFEGIVTRDGGNSVYVENYDDETDMWYGMYVYYGFNVSGEGLEILDVGNHVKVVGSVQYYETGDSYQISDVQYRIMKPDDPKNLQLLDNEKHDPSYRLTDPATFRNGKVSVIIGDEKKELAYAEAALYTSVEMKDLKVVSVYTTKNPASSSKGAMTLTCQAPDGTMIDVRTVVLYDENGELITGSYFLNKTIDVKGIIDYYNYKSDDDASTEDNTDFPYQIKLLSLGDVTVK